MCILQKTIPVLLSVQRLSADCALLHVPFLLPSEKPCSLSDSSKGDSLFSFRLFLQVQDGSADAHIVFSFASIVSAGLIHFISFARSAIMQVNSAKRNCTFCFHRKSVKNNFISHKLQPKAMYFFFCKNLHYLIHIRIFFF